MSTPQMRAAAGGKAPVTEATPAAATTSTTNSNKDAAATPVDSKPVQTKKNRCGVLCGF
jgi:hypothetical protein